MITIKKPGTLPRQAYYAECPQCTCDFKYYTENVTIIAPENKVILCPSCNEPIPHEENTDPSRFFQNQGINGEKKYVGE